MLFKTSYLEVGTVSLTSSEDIRVRLCRPLARARGSSRHLGCPIRSPVGCPTRRGRGPLGAVPPVVLTTPLEIVRAVPVCETVLAIVRAGGKKHSTHQLSYISSRYRWFQTKILSSYDIELICSAKSVCPHKKKLLLSQWLQHMARLPLKAVFPKVYSVIYCFGGSMCTGGLPPIKAGLEMRSTHTFQLLLLHPRCRDLETVISTLNQEVLPTSSHPLLPLSSRGCREILRGIVRLWLHGGDTAKATGNL